MNVQTHRLFIIFAIALGLIPLEAISASYRIAKMDSPDHELITHIVEKAYSKLGISVEFIEYPGKRALSESAKGAVDAELSRIFEVGEEHPTLIRIPTPIFWFNAIVFAKNKDLKIENWNSIRELKVGIIRGMRFSEIGTRDFPSVVAIENPLNLYKLLEADRVQVVVFSDLNGAYYLHQGHFKNIHALSPSLQRIESYHYVHEKHRDLVPRLDAEFKRMKASGELESMRQEFAQSILSKAPIDQK